jgi:hypothetical protein
VHGWPARSDYKILKSEAGALASEVKDITYAWSKNNTDNYGLLGGILGEDKYDELTGIGTYTIPTEPVSYDPTITNATLTHERKRKEEEWELVRTSWFIRKGFLRGIVDNLRDVLNKQYYSQLRNRLTAYRNVTPFPSRSWSTSQQSLVPTGRQGQEGTKGRVLHKMGWR